MAAPANPPTASTSSNTSRICVKCNKPILKNQKAFKTDKGATIHGPCYNCDQCGANMLGKRVGSVPSANNDGTFIKVCWDCMMKHPHYSILFAGQTDKPATVPSKIMTCKECKLNIIGKAIKTKLGDHYHDDCYKCFRCKLTLSGRTYGYFQNNKWCQNCLNTRASGIGDITTQPTQQYANKNAYVETMTKLKTNKIGMVNKMAARGTYERRCGHCNKKIAGPGITIQRDNSKIEYHRWCLHCDDCKKKINYTHVKIIKDKMFCPGCVGKWTSAVVK